MLGRVKQNLAYSSTLNTRNTTCNLVELYHNSENCNFVKHLLLIPIERVRIGDDKKTSTPTKKDTLAKRGKYYKLK